MFLLKLLPTTIVVLLAGQSRADSTGWDLDLACQPVGQESKAIFRAAATEQLAYTLSADWGPVDQVHVTQLGPNDVFTFTHTYETAGEYSTTFSASIGPQRITLRNTCQPIVEPVVEPNANDTPTGAPAEDDGGDDLQKGIGGDSSAAFSVVLDTNSAAVASVAGAVALVLL